MSNSLDASIFTFGDGFHAMYLKEAMTMLSSAYTTVMDNVVYNGNYNENKLRDDLIKYLPAKKEGIMMTLDTESRDIDNDNVRIDITIITLEVLSQPEKDFEKRITIECKIIGVDHYINKNGIISYVEGKYASQLSVAGMIGFIFKEKAEQVKNKINKKLKSHSTIKTLGYLEKKELENNFLNFYISTHERNKLTPINLYHLLLDYSESITMSN
jgi:hypothetical protein